MDSRALALIKRPALVHPQTVQLTERTPRLNLDPTKDYVVQVPSGTVLTSGAVIRGGHNVVLEKAVLLYAPPVPPTGLPTVTADPSTSELRQRGLFLTEQTGIMYVNDLQIRGALKEGIQLAERSPHVAVVLRRIVIDPVVGSKSGWHADLLQTWAGPARLVVDDFAGTSEFQGMFLRPNELWPNGPRPEFFWLHNVRLDVSAGLYALWTDGFGAFPLKASAVVVKPRSANRDAWLWPKPSTGDTTWSKVKAAPLLP
jgi:hypothetical protein